MTAQPPALLQVLPALRSGGVERGTLEIAEAQIAAGFRAIVASAGGEMVPALEALGARHITLPLTAKSPFALWRNATSLTALARAEGVALIHARSRAPAWSALMAARRAGLPTPASLSGPAWRRLPLRPWCGRRRRRTTLPARF